MSDWLTMKAAEAYSGYSRWTLRRWAREGRLKLSKSTPTRQGRVRIKREDLEAALRAG